MEEGFAQVHEDGVKIHFASYFPLRLGVKPLEKKV
jgi:hypothetical protein